MKVGYARTSTIEQVAGIEAQVRDLLAAGVEKENIFQEHASAVKQRDGLEKALAFVRKGDTLIVTKLDRLARSVPDLYKIVDILKEKEVNLNILTLGVDTGTAAGKVMLTMMGAFAEFEREIMLERQKEGIEKAKEEGKYIGRRPIPAEIVQAVETFLETGVSKTWIAKRLNIGEATVYRIAKKWRVRPPSK
jgi:DNA invertase Pin-like site-specific DNA recombinase